MVDDQIRNLVPAKIAGMTTILVGDEEGDVHVDLSIPTILELTTALPELRTKQECPDEK
jgi:FMN phosphatase YigB (HAD superfamily)